MPPYEEWGSCCSYGEGGWTEAFVDDNKKQDQLIEGILSKI